MVDIVQNGNPVLRKIAQEVPLDEIGKPKFQKIFKDMSEALHSQYDGVAIAAPQIAVSYRIFVVSGKIFNPDFLEGKTKSEEKGKDIICINPVITKISKDKKLLSEGCLSVRPLYGKVRRATRVTIEAYNEHGEKHVFEGAGLLAHIFQHEIDHLDGILFIDKARDLHEETLEGFHG